MSLNDQDFNTVRHKLEFCIQWWIQDFPEEEAPTPRGGRGANIWFCQNFPKTAWNWKNLDPRGGGGGSVARAPSDPPLAYVVYYFTKIYFKLFKIEAKA